MISYINRTPNYASLLVGLLVLIFAAPLIPAERPGYVIELSFDLVLLAGAYSAAWRGPHRWPFLTLTVVTLIARWSYQLFEHVDFGVVSTALTVVWFTYAIAIIITARFRERVVTVNTILGAVVAYLLTAVAFAEVFGLIEGLRPGSFSGIPPDANAVQVDNALIYFSLDCITTMGYGEITPLSKLTRSLSVLEGVFGTLFIAIMIGRLVGLNVASASERKRS